MFGTRILTLSTIALLLVGMAKASQATQYGTADEAKALLNRVVAALKDNKTKALQDFNTGNDGFKDHDLYVLCANASDGIITASPNSNGMSLNDFPPECDEDRYRERGERDNVLVASPWFNQATQETYVLYESRRSNLRCGLLGRINHDTTSCKDQQTAFRLTQEPNLSFRRSTLPPCRQIAQRYDQKQ